MHRLEHQADLTKHQAMEKLIREFITPLEREDILSLTSAIDDVTDSIEDVLLRLYMFNIRTLRPDALEFSKIITDSLHAVAGSDGRVSKFSQIEINQRQNHRNQSFRGVGDKLYTEPYTAFTQNRRSRHTAGLDYHLRAFREMLRQV